MRNAALHRPSALRHHRELGVHRFFVVDNCSTVGMLELPAKEAVVHVFTIAEDHVGSHWDVHRIDAMLDAFVAGHWTLTIDTDDAQQRAS